MSIHIRIVAAAVSFIVSLLLGKLLIPILHKLKYGQTILDIGPNWHKSKQGTPTMGGLMFVAAVIIAILVCVLSVVISGENYNLIELKKVLAGLIMALGFGFVGFVDDYIKVVKKRNLGLSVMGKIVMQVVIIAAYFWTMIILGETQTGIVFPFIGTLNMSPFVYYPIMGIAIIYIVNAVNLTDGVDGLCGSITFVYASVFMFIASIIGNYWHNVYAVCLAAALLGFLIWNLHPAKIFMGDTGSMFLGGSVVALGFGTGLPILILIVGIVYVIEALTVVIQVFYFKLTKGKRLFKMTPIHHHFELSGWSENKIVVVFSIITLIAGTIGILCSFGA